MVNASTFAKAIQPNLWGYFYETTWLDLQTTKNFQWGEIVSVGKNTFTLRVHHTHRAFTLIPTHLLRSRYPTLPMMSSVLKKSRLI